MSRAVNVKWCGDERAAEKGPDLAFWRQNNRNAEGNHRASVKIKEEKGRFNESIVGARIRRPMVRLSRRCYIENNCVIENQSRPV